MARSLVYTRKSPQSTTTRTFLMYTIHTSETCPWCQRAKLLIDRIGGEYEEIQQKHPDWPTVPYILKDGQPIGGYTELAWSIRNS